MYSFGIFLYGLFIRIAAIFNHKARLWVEGRQNLFPLLDANLRSLNSKKRIWIHASSLGEFEQGRPIIEALKTHYPDDAIILTFFSPSGYTVQKDYAQADGVFYLPLDTKKNASRFLDLVQPSLAIFIKYEFWPHFFSALHSRKIPLILVSSIFRKNQWFFKPYFSSYRKVLFCVTHFFVQTEESKTLLEQIGIQDITIAGDTRFDRVATIAREAEEISIAKSFVQDKKAIVVGSSWPPDETLLSRYAKSHSGIKWIVAPHQIDKSHIEAIEKLFSPKKTIRYSTAKNSDNLANYDVLIVDTIGLLSRLYRYGSIAYIGGGFGKGIHNILEAAAFGIPVLFGPRYHKFEEAKQLIAHGGAISITQYRILEQQLDTWLSDAESYAKASGATKQFVDSQTGATTKILETIALYL